MSEDILAVLQKRAPTFSKGQRRIAQYILDSYDKAAFMTAGRLGETVKVSESTVVRFATSWATTQESMDALCEALKRFSD